MRIEVYDCKDGSITCVTEGDPNKEILCGEDPRLLRTIEGEDWEDCMKKHYELMGWEPYQK